jgi:hypothetical protein
MLARNDSKRRMSRLWPSLKACGTGTASWAGSRRRRNNVSLLERLSSVQRIACEIPACGSRGASEDSVPWIRLGLDLPGRPERGGIHRGTSCAEPFCRCDSLTLVCSRYSAKLVGEAAPQQACQGSSRCVAGALSSRAARGSRRCRVSPLGTGFGDRFEDVRGGQGPSREGSNEERNEPVCRESVVSSGFPAAHNSSSNPPW